MRGLLLRAGTAAWALALGCGKEVTGGEVCDGPPVAEDSGSGGESGSSGGTPSGCRPADSEPWIGSPCAVDSDCAYEEGLCLRLDEAVACGTCSASCVAECPERDGASQSFCIDGSTIGVEATGYCVSGCDGGCNEGDACAPRPGYMDPDSSAPVCVPAEFVDPPETECQQELLDLGAVFSPTTHATQSPPGAPTLECAVEDPVLLYGPIHGVVLRHARDDDTDPVLVACRAAQSIVRSTAVARDLGAREILHLGTYQCRTTADGSTLSMHGLGLAFDIAGFMRCDGTRVTVAFDWERLDPTPESANGRFLRSFTDTSWKMELWNTILTPDFNLAHYDHFHLDLDPSESRYE